MPCLTGSTSSPRRLALLGASAVVLGAVLVTGGPAAAATGASPYDKRSTSRVSVGPGGAQRATGGTLPGERSLSVSADGRYVAFISDASDLVLGDTNGSADAFVRDRVAGTTRRVSVDTDGSQLDYQTGGVISVSLSDDGRKVAYVSREEQSGRHGYDRVLWHDLDSGTVRQLDAGSLLVLAGISADGRWVAHRHFFADAYYAEIRLQDGTTGATTRNFRISDLARVGQLSGDGQQIGLTMLQDANDYSSPYQALVRGTAGGSATRVSTSPSGGAGNDDSSAPALSRTGRYAVFTSAASNLVASDTNGVVDVFLRDRQARTTRRVSVSSGGQQGNRASGSSGSAAVSADGRFVAFQSFASNLVAGDTNGRPDVFVRDVVTGATSRVSVSSSGVQAAGGSSSPKLSADGLSTAFLSAAGNLVPGDTNGLQDVFVRDAGGS